MFKNISLIIFFISISIFAQKADTISVPTSKDTLSIQSSDTLAVSDTASRKKSDIDAVVYASASDSLTFDVKNKKMYIYGTGQLKYKKSELSSGEVIADFVTHTLSAKGIVDTADSTAEKFVQTPVLSEAGEQYEGINLKYNFKTQQGFISLAKNGEKDSRYEGKKVKKVSNNTFFIEDGIYTTCEGDPPHTHFSANKMKVIQGDKIIAEWIFMHIGGVPIPIPLPFAVFPNETGRRSGLIIPTYGLTSDKGQFFRNFGYFFAINDYLDLTLTGDYYTRGGFGASSRVRYAKRYEYNGNLTAEYINTMIGEDNDPDKSRSKQWSINLNHNQDFNPTTRLSAQLSFQSGDFLSNNSTNYESILTQNVTSNANFQKRWEGSNNSLTIGYTRVQNLESGNINEILPSATFNMPLKYPFRKDGKGQSKDQSWYEYIGYNYSNKFLNKRDKTDGDLKIRGGLQHDVGLSASPKVGYISVSPSFRYSEKWYNKRIKREFIELNDAKGQRDTLIEKDIHELNFVRNFNFAFGANTKIYGMFPINTFGIEAFRHTVTPNISYNYRPDFSKDFWGYYDSYTDTTGTEVRYDKYSREVFGGAGSGESQSINFSIGNVFEMKTLKDPTDTTSEAKKIQLLNLNASTSYNFVADSLKLADLRLSYRTQIGEFLSFNGSSSYSFYDEVNGKKINQLLVSNGKGLLRLNNLNLSFTASISGDKIKGEDRTGVDNQIDNEFESFNRQDFLDIYDEPPADFSIPWNLSLNYNYSINRFNPEPSSTIGGTLGINLTENWKITMRGNYDFRQKDFVTPTITIFRDLHCWEMNLRWNPIGSRRGFLFEIRMKAPELRDIKVRKSAGGLSGF